MSKYLTPALKLLRDAQADLLVARGRVGTARSIVSSDDLSSINRFRAGSLRDSLVEADCLGDRVAGTLRSVESELLSERPSQRQQFIAHVLDQVDVDYRPSRQSVPYGSTWASFDSSEAEVLTRSVVVEVEFDDDVPVEFKADYAVGQYGQESVELRCRLRSISPQGRSMIATYAVCLESEYDDSVPSDCHPVLPAVASA